MGEAQLPMKSRKVDAAESGQERAAPSHMAVDSQSKLPKAIPSPVTGVVLAGGLSSRFGSHKAWHEIDGRPMVIRVLDELQQVAEEVVVSVRSPADSIGGYACVADHFQGEGPLAGLHAALRAASHDWVLVVACDLPFVVATDLKQLLAARDGAVSAVVARDGGNRLHPHCGCYHRSTLPEVQSMLKGTERALHQLLDRLVIKSVRLPDASLVNVNRISDLSD